MNTITPRSEPRLVLFVKPHVAAPKPAERRREPVYFLKAHIAGDGQLGGYAHKGGYYLHNGHWHKINKDKPAPKSAPKASHPEAAGSHIPAKHLTDDEWSQLKLPDSNVNAPTYNAQLDKLKEMAEAGHVTGIVGSGYGINTYGKKLAVVANHLLGKYGSPHKVAPGQKAGEHPAVQGSVDAVVEHKDAVIKEAIEHLKEDANQAGMPAGEAAEDKALVQKLESAHAVKLPDAPTPSTANLSAIPWDKMLLPATNSNAGSHNKKVAQIKALAEAGDIAGLEAMKFGVNTYGKKQALLAQTAIAGLKQAPIVPVAPTKPVESKVESASSHDLEKYIKVAANSIGELRKTDVMRVLESNSSVNRKLANYITQKRPDLAGEVKEVMEDEFGIHDWEDSKAPAAAMSEVDAAAHEAATSPHNSEPQPSQAQIEAGNYKKGHIRVSGVNVTVENPRGSERSGVDANGHEWSHVMSDHYGYIKRTTGADGENVDVYVGPNVDSKSIFVVDQLNQETGQFDEHKVMMGYNTKEEAVAAYSSNFDKGWRVGPVTELTTAGFKEWIDGDGANAPLDPAGVKAIGDQGPHEGDRNDEGLVFRGGRWHREGEKADDGLSDDPNSPNYRFKDTGYIAGSRKEQVTEMFRDAVRKGKMLRGGTLDWDEIEKNPREAKTLITKSNLFGSVDWESLKSAGMEPGAGFLVDRVYAAVPQEPNADNPTARKDFALALESLRDRMESCKTPEQVTTVLNEIREELEGVVLTDEQSKVYAQKMDAYNAKKQFARESEAVLDGYRMAMTKPRHELQGLEFEQSKRTRRGWKPDPVIDEQIIKTKQELDAANDAYQKYMYEHPELVSKKRQHGGGWVSFENDLEFAASIIRADAEAYMRSIRQENLVNNPVTRAWLTLGPRFLGVVNYRRAKGSDAFAGHVANAKSGKVKDWSWAEKEAKPGKKATKREVAFQLKVAENYERVGGRSVSANSTSQFKNEFGLRDVQSGNWVLNDPNSAAWHVQKSTEAFADLADLLGAKDKDVSLNGRIAMAFGARGRGNSGFDGAARAHYEPVHRVINLTKMGGGGTLAHEWSHALDNLIIEAETGKPAGVDDFVSENPDLLAPGKIKDAYVALRSAMLDGTVFGAVKLKYSARDVAVAKLNVDAARPNRIAIAIKNAADASAAVRAVDTLLAVNKDSTPRAKRNANDWRRIAVAYHDKNGADQEVTVAAGPAMSSYAAEATSLDGPGSEYWSQPREMFARAFQAYVEDKLAEQGRKNDYLSAYADNKYYIDPFTGPKKPFPEGNERKRINLAFDALISALAESGTLAKAMAAFFGNAEQMPQI